MEEILNFILNTYGSLASPRFDFVMKLEESRPYDRLIQGLRSTFLIEEEFDANEDVSFGYKLTRGNRKWFLRISMVGPFAILLRLFPAGDVELVNSNIALSNMENQLIQTLSAHDLRLLDRNILEKPISLKLFNTPQESTKIYQALFTDTEMLPWTKS